VLLSLSLSFPLCILIVMWSRSFSSLTWRIDLQHSNTAQQQHTASVTAEPALAILQLKLRNPTPPLHTDTAGVIGSNGDVTGQRGAGEKRESESVGSAGEVDVIMTMDRAAVNSVIAQLDEIDRVAQLKSG